MKWFKHQSTAAIDSRLKRVRLKYGMEGYGLYWYLLECIARCVEPHNLTFELEEDAELVSLEVGIHRERVEEMMRYMCELGLFEDSGGTITCLKMRDRSDEYTAKLMRSQASVRTKSVPAPEKVPHIRTERTEKKKPIPSDFTVSKQVQDWAKRNGHKRLNQHLEYFVDRCVAKGYRYADFDAAFKEAIRKNWAGL